MTEVAEVLSRYGVDLSEGDVAAMLDEELRAMPVPAAAVPAGGVVAYLAEHGGPTAAAAVRSWAPRDEQRQRVRSATANAAQLAAGTLSVDRAAERLGVDASRVRHLINDRPPRLYAVKVGHHRRIPDWQIHDGATLPGLRLVVQGLPATVHPLDLTAVMTTPQDELGGRTPVEHLAGGGEPEPVLNLVADLGRW